MQVTLIKVTVQYDGLKVRVLLCRLQKIVGMQYKVFFFLIIQN